MPRKKSQEVKEEKAVNENFEPWTVDIRGQLGDEVKAEDLDKLSASLAPKGRKLAKVFCTDKQLESLKDIKGYSDVEFVK